MRLRNLLLVEDDTVDQRRIQRFLRSKDGAGPVAVRVVATGAEGLRELEEQSFDCLLLDHELPDVDGLSIVRLLRGSQEPAQRQLPIVLITGITDEGLLDRAFDSGVSDYVSKDGLTESQLRVALARAFARQERVGESGTGRAQPAGSARWEAAKQMAGAVAHRLNNALVPLVSFDEMVARRVRDRIPADYLEDMSACVKRLERLGRHLVQVTGSVHRAVESIDVGSLVRSLDLSNALVATPSPSHSCSVVANHDDLSLILRALVRNAVESQGTYHPISITIVPRVMSEEGWFTPVPVTEGNMLAVEVRDEGPGFDLDQLPHVFDPFWTTKPSSDGLGLPIALGLAQHYGGTVAIQRRDSGARVRLILPHARSER